MHNDPFMERQDKYAGISPLLLVGIVITVGPHLLQAVGVNAWSWISGIGIIVILAGAAHTIYLKLG